MEARDGVMGDRQRDGDDPQDSGGGSGATPSFPLMFDDERPSLLRRVVGSRPAKPRERAVQEPPDPHAEPGSAEPEAPPAAEAAQEAGPPAGGAGPLHRLTLQLLPGRLLPLDPDVIQQEVRFLRGGTRDADVTLGWAEDEPPGHVTLNHPSLEPRHARMRFQDGRWSIESLSPHHPVRVNGEPVPAGGSPRALDGGDRVRLGEVEFRFLWP